MPRRLDLLDRFSASLAPQYRANLTAVIDSCRDRNVIYNQKQVTNENKITRLEIAVTTNRREMDEFEGQVCRFRNGCAGRVLPPQRIGNAAVVVPIHLVSIQEVDHQRQLRLDATAAVEKDLKAAKKFRAHITRERSRIQKDLAECDTRRTFLAQFP